ILIGGAWSTYSASLTESSAGVSFALPAAGTYQYVITDYVNGVTEAQASGSISFTAASSSISVGASVAGPGTVNSLSAGVTASETPIYNESGQIVGYTVTGSTVTVSWAVDSGVTSSSLKVLIGGAWQTYTPTVTESGTCSVSFAMPAAQTSQYIIADVAGGETEAQASGNIYFSGWNSGSAGSVSIQSESQLGGVGGFADLGNGNLGWTTGANSGDSVVFYYWTGSSWATAGVGTSGSYYYTNLSGLSGSYAFEIVYTASGAAAPYRVERGTVTINHSSTPASSSIGTPAQVGAVGGFENLGNGVFGWTTAKTSSSDSIVFHYKASGASSWAGTLAVSGSGPYSVNLSSLSGAIDYEVDYIASGATRPYAVGRGTVTVGTSTTAGSVSMGTPTPLGAVGGFKDLGNGVFGWTTVPNSGDTVGFSYYSSGTWKPLTVTAVSSGGNTYQSVNLSGLAAGSYAYEVTYSASGATEPYSFGRGTVTVGTSTAVSVPTQLTSISGFTSLGNGLFGWTTAP